MKYSTVLLFAAGAYAASSSADEAARATVTEAPVLNKVAACIKDNCKAGNMKCSASCGFVPAPNSIQAEGNVNCVSSACVPLQTDVPAYSMCLDDCREKWFYNPANAGGVPENEAAPTGGSGSKGTGSGTSGSGSGSGSEGSDSEGAAATGTESGSTAKPSATGNSAGNKITFSLAGVLGAVGLIAFAL